MASKSFWRRAYIGLFTNEDIFSFHKTLGSLCLLHFIYRFTLVGDRDMGFGTSIETVQLQSYLTLMMNWKCNIMFQPIWILIHAVLSASSIIFKLPKRRILEGSRIWPEYRLHSIAFAYRSLACMLLIWAERYFGTAESPSYFWNVIIVVATLMAADAGTWWVGDASRSSTINDLKAPLAMK